MAKLKQVWLGSSGLTKSLYYLNTGKLYEMWVDLYNMIVWMYDLGVELYVLLCVKLDKLAILPL